MNSRRMEDDLTSEEITRLSALTVALVEGPAKKRVRYAFLLAAATLEIGDGQDSPAARRLRLLAKEV